MARQILARHRAVQVARSSGKIAETVRNGRNFIGQNKVIGLAGVQGFDAGQIFGLGFDGIRHFQQAGRALRRGGQSPCGESLHSRCHGVIHLPGRGLGQFHDHFASSRCEDDFAFSDPFDKTATR